MNIQQWLLARREGRLAAMPLGMPLAMASFGDEITVFGMDGYGNWNVYGDGNGNGDGIVGSGYGYGDGIGNRNGYGKSKCSSRIMSFNSKEES